jgi:hypothetical protein
MKTTKEPTAIRNSSKETRDEQTTRKSVLTESDTERYQKYLNDFEDLTAELPAIEEINLIPQLPVLSLSVSGLYSASSFYKIEKPLRLKTEEDGIIEATAPILSTPIQPLPLQHIPVFPLFYNEELRLDVDGRYPQMAASGKIISLFTNVHWIANLTKSATPNTWEGNIWYKKGSVNFFKYNEVKITAIRSIFPANRKATITLGGSGLTDRVITLQYNTSYDHNVEFEFDYEDGISPITEIQSHAHPNHPANLPNEILSINTIYRRAGFNVTHTAGAGSVPSALKGANGTWSDNEMHDAMQVYWSKFANIPQWSMWTFFAKQHDMGHSLGGMMFDDIGPNHRQGTSIFYDSFIADAPGYDSNKTAWVDRMKFWTAVHEMGHAFNLAHSWQKTLGNHWIPSIVNEPEARSFMNYPYNVTGGETAFFANFEYRFSDQELLFMRHAPNEFVEMGNANWFDNHAFEWTNTSRTPALQLEARVHRTKNEFEFMEPVNIELKLKNISTLPVNIDENILKDLHEMTIVVKRNDDPAKQFYPFAHKCFNGTKRALLSGEAIYESLFLSSGKKGWIITDPGYYNIQLCLHTNNEDYVSNMLKIRVNPPKNYDESYLAQDFFNDEVSRIIAFNGSLVLEKGNNILREVSGRLKGTRVADHANILLAKPLTKDYKLLNFTTDSPNHLTSVSNANGEIKVVKSNPQEANKMFEKAVDKSAKDDKELANNIEQVVDTVGHINSRKVINDYSESLMNDGKKKEAIQIQENLLKVYQTKGVVQNVLEDVRAKINRMKNSSK